jgi:hypothetical protein
MNLYHAEVRVNNVRQDAASNQRYRNYKGHLTANIDEGRYDDRMFDALVELGAGPWIVSEKEYMDGLGFAQSRYDYNQILEQLHNFQKPGVPYKGYNRSYRRALSSMIEEVKPARLKTLKYRTRADIEKALPKKDTHAGFSYLETGLRKKGEYLDILEAELEKVFAKAILHGSFNAPILIGYRTQGSGLYDDEGHRTGEFKEKSRFVSMIDIYLIMAESVYARPFQQWLAGTDWYAGGKDDTAILFSIRRRVQRGYHMLTIDYSKYDQSISYWLIRDAFEIVRAAFDDPDFDGALFEVIVKDFIYKVFLDGEGNLVYADKGVPSGSMFTQIIDSLVNRLMILTYKYSQHEDIEAMMIMGDDNIIFSKSFIDINKLSEFLLHMFGITAHPDKCSYTAPGGDPEFLSRIWKAGGVYRNPKVLLSKLLFPERFRPYDKEDFSPYDILNSYIDSYMLGMYELLPYDSIAKIRKQPRKLSGDRAARHTMSGSAYYRYCYS